MVKKKESTTSLLFRQLTRSIKTNWKQFISVIGISFLAVCLFCGLTANANNIKERAELLYTDTNYADIYVTTSGLEKNDLTSIQGLSGVEVAEKRTTISMINKTTGGSFTMLAEATNSTLSVPEIVTGEKGFLLPRGYMNSHSDIQIGTTLTFTVNNYFKSSLSKYSTYLNACLKEGKTNILLDDNIDLSFTVTGTMLHPEAVQNTRFTSPIAYTDYGTITTSIYNLVKENFDITKLDNIASLVGAGNTLNIISGLSSSLDSQILVNYSNVDKTLEDINTYFSSKGDSSNLVIANKKESLTCYQALDQDIQQAMKLTFVFPVIFFLVSLLVILTTISQMIIKERMQIGSLKAIGVPKSKIYLHYVSYGLVLTFIGSLLGFIVGPLFIPNVMNIKYELLWDIPSLHAKFFYPLSLAMVALMLVSSLVASFLVSYSVIREKPVDTLRPKTPKFSHKKDIDPSKLEFKKVSSWKLTFKMAIRNMNRNKMKTLMVILGTLGCTSLLVCGFGIMDTLNYDVYTDLNHTLVREVTATPSETSPELKSEIEGLDHVKQVDEVVIYPATISSESSLSVSMYLMDEDNVAFSPDIKAGSITIDKRTAERIGASEGSTLTIVVNGKVQEMEITNIFSSSIIKGIFGYRSDFTDFNLSSNSYWITCDQRTNNSLVAEELKALNLDQFSASDSIYTMDDYMEMANNLLSSITIMTRVVEVFAILLSIVVIYNLTSLNISERTRDIATMKVLGFSYKEISRTLITEIMFDTLIGTLLGLPIGLPVCMLVLAVNKTDLLTFIYHIDGISYLYAALISLGAALVVNLIQSLKAKKIKMVESLKSVE